MIDEINIPQKNIRKSLFVGEQRKAITKIYSVLSTQSHTNVETINGSHYPYVKNRVKDMLWYIKLLSFYNILEFINNFPTTQNIVHLIFKHENIEKFLNEIMHMVSYKGQLGDFFPNHPSIPKGIVYITNNQLILKL